MLSGVIAFLHLTSEILLNAQPQAEALHKAPIATQAVHDSAQRVLHTCHDFSLVLSMLTDLITHKECHGTNASPFALLD